MAMMRWSDMGKRAKPCATSSGRVSSLRHYVSRSTDKDCDDPGEGRRYCGTARVMVMICQGNISSNIPNMKSCRGDQAKLWRWHVHIRRSCTLYVEMSYYRLNQAQPAQNADLFRSRLHIYMSDLTEQKGPLGCIRNLL